MPSRILRGCLLSLLLGACAAPPPEPPAEADTPRPPVETRSRVDHAVATTGDIITYTVTVDYDPAYEIDLAEPGADIAGFRIVDVGSEEPRDERGRRIEERWYKLRADLVGSYVLPPVIVSYHYSKHDNNHDDNHDNNHDNNLSADEAEMIETIETSEIFIEVESVLATAEGDVTDIRGLKPLRQIERPTPWWWYAAGSGGAVLLASIAFLLWRRGRKTVEVPPRPAHEVAFEALDRLRRTDFEDPEAIRLFHFEISQVVRVYVESRFALNATDLTTEEIVAHLDELRGVDRESREGLRRFLAATDQVKFAAYVPAENEIQETYESALAFVEETSQRPEEVRSPEKAGENAGKNAAEAAGQDDAAEPEEIAA